MIQREQLLNLSSKEFFLMPGGLNMVYKDEDCRFLWVNSSLGELDTFKVRNDIQWFKIKLSKVQSVYAKLVEFIPDDIWPSLIPK